MFLISLTYVQSLEAVDACLERHIAFLEKYYASGNFIVSGRKNPRIGGVILCRAESIEEVRAIIAEDPFHQEGVADYDVMEFQPTKCAEGFETFMG
ncbi:YciI family protein [Pseudodesulfovibrio sp. zrk46]|uniref:YciI family protein n=1 Tax=Pseudodesulfovibrio sp. zrk46 TaxID=2725288 RepID=UPI0014498B28|nr:YciI family protein [Pseudodesulfovibrio sp. zrk46]QJB55270.1 GTP cyclohydrolase [Pseudodesulfovibrio sp. zrk46]